MKQYCYILELVVHVKNIMFDGIFLFGICIISILLLSVTGVNANKLIDKPIVVKIIKFSTIDMDCDLNGCVKGCFGSIRVSNTSDYQVAEISIVFPIKDPRFDEGRQGLVVSDSKIEINKTIDITGSTIQQTCENVNFLKPSIDCIYLNGISCKSNIREDLR